MIDIKESLLKTFVFMLFFVISIMICNPSFCKKPANEKKIYEWAPIPEKSVLEKAKGLKSQNGLVVLERKSEINIGGFFAWLSGRPSVIKEEFIRFMIIDENGVKNAETDIETISISKVEEVEARTILPDGKIIKVDQEKDIEMVEYEAIKNKKVLFSAGKVKFPSPQVGAILDIHYRITSNSFVLSWLEPLTYNKMPTIKLNMKFAITDIGIGWQVITLNTTKSDILKLVKSGEVELNLNDILPTKEEPLAPPSYYHQPYVFAFSNLLDKKIANNIPSVWTSEINLDEYWLPQTLNIDNTPFKPYWSNFLEEFEKEKNNFLKDFQKQKIEFASSDLMQLPVLERAQKVFSFAESTVFMQSEFKKTKNLSSGKSSTLTKSLKEGFEGKDEIAFFISHLFDIYQIPHQDGIIVNRYAIRFSPYIPNAYVFEPVYAIKVLGSDLKPVFVTGDMNIPFASLDSEYQNSVFIYKDSKGTIFSEKTPENTLGGDTKKCFFEFTFKNDLSYEGKVILEESGSCSNELTEYLQKANRIENEKKKDKKLKDKKTNKEYEEKEKFVKNELELTNSKLKIESWNILKIPPNSSENLKIEYKLTGSLAKENIGDLMLVYPIPFLGEYSSSFLEDKRNFPIWFPNKEVCEYEGKLIFPRDIRIEDIPQNESFQSEDNFSFSFELQKGLSGNENVLKVKLIISNPLFSSPKKYSTVKHFYSLLTKALNNRILVKKDENVQ